MTTLDRRELVDQVAERLDHHPDTEARVEAAWDALERLTCPATAADVEIIRRALTVPLTAVEAAVDEIVQRESEPVDY